MKHFKRLLICLLIVATLFALASCDDKPQNRTLPNGTVPNLGDNEAAVIINNGNDDYEVYVVDLTTVMPTVDSIFCNTVLSQLNSNQGLVLDWTKGEFGMYINAIGGLTPDAANNEYVEIFTSNPDYQGTWAGVTTIEAGNLTLKSAAVGVSAMQVAAGDVIYFELASY